MSRADYDSIDRSRDSKEFSGTENIASDIKSYSIFRRLDQQNKSLERKMNSIGKRYSRSQIEEPIALIPVNPISTAVNLKELSLFIDDRRGMDENLSDQPSSPSRIARRQFTEELDREIESPKRKSKALKDQRGEELFFNETEWLEDEYMSSTYPRVRSDTQIDDELKDVQTLKVPPVKTPKRQIEKEKKTVDLISKQKNSPKRKGKTDKDDEKDGINSWARKANSSSTSLTNMDHESTKSRHF